MIATAIRLAALVPLLAGGGGALFGPAFLGEAAGPATTSHLRYLSGVLLGLGLVALWCAADLGRRRDVFAALCAAVALGGLARLAGLPADDPLPPWPHLAALVMELGVVPALWWASRRASQTPPPAP
jgi:peptidoglycan/LPS O-acetylase OafA/YrhL